MASHFTDINYLTGRRMQRNKNNDIGKDRAPHLKQSLKRFKKNIPPPDDVNFYSKILNKRALNPIKPSTSNKRRVTVEPDLDIFGNDRRQRFERCGIFRNSIGRQIHLEPKSKLTFPKKNNIIEYCEAFAQTESPVEAQASLFENVFKDDAINQQPPLTTFIEKIDKTPNSSSKNRDTTLNSSGTNKDWHGSLNTNEPLGQQLFDPALESFTDFFQSFEQSQPIGPLTISSPIFTDQPNENNNYYENDLSLPLPSPIPTRHRSENTFENPKYTEIQTPKISNSSFIPPDSVEVFLDSPILPSEISKQFSGSSISAPLDHHIDPLTENVQKLYQLISPRSYENVKNIVQSSPYLFQFDNSMWDFWCFFLHHTGIPSFPYKLFCFIYLMIKLIHLLKFSFHIHLQNVNYSKQHLLCSLVVRGFCCLISLRYAFQELDGLLVRWIDWLLCGLVVLVVGAHVQWIGHIRVKAGQITTSHKWNDHSIHLVCLIVEVSKVLFAFALHQRTKHGWLISRRGTVTSANGERFYAGVAWTSRLTDNHLTEEYFQLGIQKRNVFAAENLGDKCAPWFEDMRCYIDSGQE